MSSHSRASLRTRGLTDSAATGWEAADCGYETRHEHEENRKYFLDSVGSDGLGPDRVLALLRDL